MQIPREIERLVRNADIVRAVIGMYKKFVLLVTMPLLLAEYFERETGEQYSVGIRAKVLLALRILRNTKKIPTLSHFLEHLYMATRILRIPRSIDGCLVECGCYRGGSTANLSLVCALTGRQLEVFDSFGGLPDPKEQDTNTLLGRESTKFQRGQFQADLNDVRANVSRWGDVSVCRFDAGYFDDVLPQFSKKCVFVFLDVDLRSSLETCVKRLWPLLQEECYLFTHEAQDTEIASLFWDTKWWQNALGSDPPGLAGAGAGLGLIPARGQFTSELGFTLKKK